MDTLTVPLHPNGLKALTVVMPAGGKINLFLNGDMLNFTLSAADGKLWATGQFDLPIGAMSLKSFQLSIEPPAPEPAASAPSVIAGQPITPGPPAPEQPVKRPRGRPRIHPPKQSPQTFDEIVGSNPGKM